MQRSTIPHSQLHSSVYAAQPNTTLKTIPLECLCSTAQYPTQNNSNRVFMQHSPIPHSKQFLSSVYAAQPNTPLKTIPIECLCSTALYPTQNNSTRVFMQRSPIPHSQQFREIFVLCVLLV